MSAGPGKTASVLWMPPDFVPGESGWPGGGLPICFPFAGRVFHEGRPFQYEIAGEVRPMAIHGFAYGLPWRVLRQDDRTAELELVDSEATQKLYPFRFKLTARFELSERELQLVLRSVHTEPLSSASRMPVAQGLHPYFATPISGGSLSQCRVETTASRQYRVTPSGGAGKAVPFPLDAVEAKGSLAEATFANLILGSLATPAARLVDESAGLATEITWTSATAPDCGYVVLWTKPGQGFHCIEPWMGLPDAVSNGQGVRWLAQGEELSQSFSIRLTATAP